MIVKIMAPAGSSFPGVNYNDKKVDQGKGELMKMKNFPSFITPESSKNEVRNYLASISQCDKVKKPQFHAVIATKFKEHSKEELANIAEEFMDEMGYGKQPFIIVFHNDTENNHVHLVSTRVDRNSGRKINDSYERLKSQKALSNILERRYGKNHEAEIDKLLKYRFSSQSQLETLLQRHGYKLVRNKLAENNFDILKNGVREKTISANDIVFSSSLKNSNRTKQLKAILTKYKNIYSNKVFKTEDYRNQDKMLPEEKKKRKYQPDISYESELQKKLKDIFGIDLIFHSKEGQLPFGYSLIDNKSKTVYKGSDIMKMNELFEFTQQTMDKKLFESLKDFNIRNQQEKDILQKYFEKLNNGKLLHNFMLFENKKAKNKETYIKIRNDVRDYLKKQNNPSVILIKTDNEQFFAIHTQHHYVGELQELIGKKQYEEFLHPIPKNQVSVNETISQPKVDKVIDALLFDLMKSSGNSVDPAEEEIRKRKKRKR